MPKEVFTNLRAKDQEWWDKLLGDLQPPPHDQKQPAPTGPAPGESGLSPVPKEALQKLLVQQKKLIDTVNGLTTLSEPPERLSIDFFPVYSRIYFEGNTNHLLPWNARFAEFHAFKYPAANDLSRVLNSDINTTLALGKHMDYDTETAVKKYSEKNLFGFEPQTIYGISTETCGILKLAALPSDLEDERPQVELDRFDTRYVASPLVQNDMLLMQQTFGFLQRQLDVVKR